MDKIASPTIGTSNKMRQSVFYPPQSLPHVITLEITTACNNFCSGCANVELSRNKAGRNTTAGYMLHWGKILEKIAKTYKDKVIIRLSGGEPTLHPEFKAIVQMIAQLKIPFAILSTGRWKKIRRETLLQMLEREEFFLGFLISLHGSDASNHCAFTESPEKSFIETCHNIAFASERGLRVFTNTVITKLNWNEVDKVCNLSKKLGADMAVFNRFIAKEHALLPTTTELKSAIQSILHLQQQTKACRIGNSMPKCFFDNNSYSTPAGFELCHISPSGKVRPDNFSHFGFGNLLESDLEEIWHSDKAKFFRNHFPESCLDCAALSSCRGGMKSLSLDSFTAQGDPLMTAPLSFEQVQFWDDDKEKNNSFMLALTSD